MAAAAPLAAPPPHPAAPAVAPLAPTIKVTATNPLGAPRASDTIALAIAELAKLTAAFDAKKIVVVDAAGKPVLSQLVDRDGDGTPDELVFQSDFAPHQTKTFGVAMGTRHLAAPGDYKVYGRFVRERHDDFAWENDQVAHRMYGPDLETFVKEPLVSSGIDTWSKRVTKLVVNEWYMTDDYHQDSGEGADFYSVGKSRGCGGLGLWVGGKLSTSRNFVTSRVLANGPIRLIFELTYAPWDAGGGARVAETKRVILDAGTPFNRFESTFTGGQGPLAVGLGIAKHAGSVVRVDAAPTSMRSWEPLKGPHGEPSGNLGCAIVLPPGAPMEPHHGDLDYLVVTPAPANGPLVYHVGSAWDQAGRIKDADAWAKAVAALAARVATPLKIELGAVPPR
jgi:unsaturated rhamnogalacturonyl hydrolase